MQAPDRADPTKIREYWQPCSPGDPAGQPMTWQDVNSDDLLEPPVQMVCLVIAIQLQTSLVMFTSLQSHFLKAQVTTRPSVNKEDLEKQVQFTEQFGQEG